MLATLGSIASQGGMPDNIIFQNGESNEKYQLVMDILYEYNGNPRYNLNPTVITRNGEKVIRLYSSNSWTNDGGNPKQILRTSNNIIAGKYKKLFVDWEGVYDRYWDGSEWVRYEDMYWLDRPFWSYCSHYKSREVIEGSLPTTYPFEIKFDSWFTPKYGSDYNTTRYNHLYIYKIWLE